MNLIQLRYFQAVCVYGAISKASEALNISQPSVSLAIKELEEEFSIKLFYRQHRGVTLTEAGEKLLKLSKELLNDADSIIRSMEEIGEKRKVLRIGIGPMIGSIVLPRLFKEYFENNPDLKVQVYERARSESLKELEEGKIDMLFLAHAGGIDPFLHSISIMNINVVCAISKDHHLSSREKVSIKDLKDENLVLFSDSFYHTDLIKSRFLGAGIKPKIIFQSSQVSTVRSMIRSNIAIGFLLDPMIRADENIKAINLDPPLSEEISLVWKDNAYTFKEKEKFKEYIKSFKL